MERGGFHGYRKLLNTNSGPKLSPDIAIGLPVSELNHTQSQNNNPPTNGDDSECTVREQDRFMPIANVIRIMRKILPPHAKISDDAKETIQECVSEYISFITGEANERCQREQRKTITAEDVLWAMSKLGFDDYIEPLTVYLHRYRELEGERSSGGGGGGGSMRGDHPGLVKRASGGMVDYGAMMPGFHLGHYHSHNGFLFGGSIEAAGYVNKSGANVGPSSAAGGVGGSETYGHCK